MVAVMAEGSQLASMLPTDVRHWWPIIEDVFTSPAVIDIQNSLLKAFEKLTEFQVVSIDATMKCCTGVMGQESYRAPKAQRDAAAFDDDHSLRRGLTVRGRTGAVLGMVTVASEYQPVGCHRSSVYHPTLLPPNSTRSSSASCPICTA